MSQTFQMLQTLPSTSFLSFDACRLASPVVAWVNDELACEASLLEHAYALPIGDDDSSAFLPQSKRFLADRYGGWGIGANGGSARCGMDRDIQIKGIGRNALAGSKTPFWHSYGGMNLSEAIRDAIWGELCHLALPFGASRALGIVGTGTSVPLPYRRPGGPSTTPRALLIRNPPLRPAHYMRAIYYAKADVARHGLCPDHIRTANALAQLEPALSGIYDLTHCATDGPARMGDGLCKMFGRMAEQSAAAFARKIMHGAFTPSNLCLDGSWTDFGTISTLSDYGRIILARNMPDQHERHRPLFKMADELSYYIRKYLHTGQESLVISGKELTDSFLRDYNRFLQVEMLKLTGIPTSRLMHISPDRRERAWNTFEKVIHEGTQEPFKLKNPCPYYRPTMPDRMGKYHFSSLIRDAVLSPGLPQLTEAAARHITDPGLCTEFVEACWSLRHAYLEQIEPKRRQQAFLFAAFNGLRFNQTIEFLYCTKLDPSIHKAVEEGADIACFISQLVAHGSLFFIAPNGEPFRCRDAEGNEVTISEAGVSMGGTQCRLADVEFPPDFCLSRSQWADLVRLEKELGRSPDAPRPGV